jgi:hypothetical protein
MFVCSGATQRFTFASNAYSRKSTNVSEFLDMLCSSYPGIQQCSAAMPLRLETGAAVSACVAAQK